MFYNNIMFSAKIAKSSRSLLTPNKQLHRKFNFLNLKHFLKLVLNSCFIPPIFGYTQNILKSSCSNIFDGIFKANIAGNFFSWNTSYNISPAMTYFYTTKLKGFGGRVQLCISTIFNGIYLFELDNGVGKVMMIISLRIH